MSKNLTQLERAALISWYGMPIRVTKDGEVHMKKGNCWGYYDEVESAKKEAHIIIERSKE